MLCFWCRFVIFFLILSDCWIVFLIINFILQCIPDRAIISLTYIRRDCQHSTTPCLTLWVWYSCQIILNLIICKEGRNPVSVNVIFAVIIQMMLQALFCSGFVKTVLFGCPNWLSVMKMILPYELTVISPFYRSILIWDIQWRHE